MRSNLPRLYFAAALALGTLTATAAGAQMRPGMGAQQQPGMQQQQQPGMQQPGMQPNPRNNAEAGFIANMRRNMKVETDLSKMALKNSSNDGVKDLAKQVISENRKNSMALTSATSSNPAISQMTFGEQTPAQTRNAEKQMKKLNGTQFDEMYLSQLNGYVKNDQAAINRASSTMDSSDMGSVLMQLRNTADQRAQQIAQIAQSENFKMK